MNIKNIFNEDEIINHNLLLIEEIYKRVWKKYNFKNSYEQKNIFQMDLTDYLTNIFLSEYKKCWYNIETINTLMKKDGIKIILTPDKRYYITLIINN